MTSKKLFLRIIATLAAVATLITLATACGKDGAIDKEEAVGIVEGAMAKLDTNAHTVTVSSYITSTDSEIAAAIGENKTTVVITIDGDNYAFTEKRGTEKIDYLFVDDVLYVNESFIGIITKESYAVTKTSDMSDADYQAKLAEMQEKKDKNYEKYVGQFLEEISFGDYESFNKETASDGRVTLTLGPLVKGAATKMQGELGNWTDAFDSIRESYIDRDRSTVTVKLDEQGRPESIKTIYALAIVFEDNYRALVSFVSELTYSYENSYLATPSDAEGYIDMNEGYLGLLDQSFTVTTDIVTKSEVDDDAIAKLKNVFGCHNIVKVDKNNFEVKYPFVGAEDAVLKLNSEYVMFGDLFFMKDEYTYNGEASAELGKYKLTAAGQDRYYKNVVMINFIPAFARGFVDITTSTDDDGNTVINCSGLAEDYFYELYESLNANYTGGKVLVPQEPECSYTVVISPEGKYLKSELAIWVTILQDATTQLVIGEEYYCVSRTFEYTEAENFYKDAAEGETWVKIPENHEDYKDPYGAFN